ncbi:hypothetical protein [Nostoc sp. FACHB-190]|uniref:hypothetical protein n=1 Tax=Nostoc sp. FACHB-190 TaxID=2692838 RepID=UPI001688D167|nr:hypothetical protein [Nostoc sp. FACHB-190]MBD2303245.1 hypothetical protein [Nostoc sp. FACHB-190]
MFLTIGNLTININHIYLIDWTNKNVIRDRNNRTKNNPIIKIITWLNENPNSENEFDYVSIYFNFSIRDANVREYQEPACRIFYWEDHEEDLKALAKAVNFDLTKIGK